MFNKKKFLTASGVTEQSRAPSRERHLTGKRSATTSKHI